MNADLVEIWRTWLSGESVTDSELWGVSMLWWGRIGKLLQLFAALTIVVEIVGPERLRRFGRSAHRRVEPATAWRIATGTYRWIRAVFRYVNAESDSEAEKLASAEMRTYKTNSLNIAVGVGLGVLISVLTGADGVGQFIAIAIGGVIFTLFSVAPFVTGGLVVVAVLLGALLDTLIVRPLARVLEVKALDKWIKGLSVVLLLVGFHFDLLAS
jgi:hypothetical protein